MAGVGDPIGRETRSHIREDGLAKRSYATEADAWAAARDVSYQVDRPHIAYLCSQRPDHWHVGAANKREAQ